MAQSGECHTERLPTTSFQFHLKNDCRNPLLTARRLLLGLDGWRAIARLALSSVKARSLPSAAGAVGAAAAHGQAVMRAWSRVAQSDAAQKFFGDPAPCTPIRKITIKQNKRRRRTTTTAPTTTATTTKEKKQKIKTHRKIVEKYGVVSSQRRQNCLPESLDHSNSGAPLCPPLQSIEYGRVRFHHGVGAWRELLDSVS